MIPVNEPRIGEQELAYVTECLRTGWISSAGRFIEEFEARWAAYCGMPHGVAVSNGTVALEAAVACLDLQARRRGDPADLHHHLVRAGRGVRRRRAGAGRLPTRAPGAWT